MKYTDAEKLEIANIIIKQMGGAGRLKAMIGAKDFLATDAGVQFRFAGKTANKCIIDYTEMDTYNMTFMKIGRLNMKTFEIPMKEIAKFEDVYSNMLNPVFEQTTGLCLSL